ncbi:GIY-YIG nuclease family protein [Rhizobium metallidurans]|uniref:GIY-YIG nuclease family protein n=1 Tax=Rhizobium metallidurans TaxID=1265931 RepID=A0A7W6CRM2_9HYPH|nr:GIY-YIG nuclease family protein [Rhizobium metallidurans]MBB3963682.1 hypothetical protein [Rhizobium metallidurans]
MTGYVEFEFDLPGALLSRLITILDDLQPAPLNAANLSNVPEEQGVYQLFLDDRLVYVGKTDAEAGLHKRLTRHARKVMYRVGLDPMRVSFKAVRIFVFTAMDLESDLIRHYGGVKAIDWNGSGFGSNDPGRERDTTKIDLGNYDAKFPIDIDREVAYAIDAGEMAADALARLKEALPYTFRFESKGGRSRKPHPDTELTPLAALTGPVTPREAIRHIVASLPKGWQATALPGYIIMYREAPRTYPHGEVIAVSGD